MEGEDESSSISKSMCKGTRRRSEIAKKNMMAERKSDILARANNTILLSLTDEVMREVMDQTNAFGLWEKLCIKY